MRSIRPARRTGRALRAAAASAACAVTALGLAVSPAAAAPAKPAAQPVAAPGQTCTAADLGKRHPIIKSTEVAPTITHFKGWYVTQGTTGYQNVTTSTQTTISVSLGLNGNIQGNFAVEALGTVGAMLGLNVQVNYTSTSSESTSVSWDFYEPGYYGVYKGTKKVTGTYASLNCNRAQQADGSWALKWIEGPDSGSFTTYTTLEEGAVRCEDNVPANSIMRKAQGLLDCETPPQAGHAPGPVTSAKATAARNAAAKDATKDTAGKAATAQATEPAARAAFTCDPGYYKIGTPDQALFWTAPLNQSDSVRLRPSTIFSGNLDQWQLCRGPENNGIAEHILVNHRSGQCLAVPEAGAAAEGTALVHRNCAADDLQRFYVYRDVPGSNKIGVQNKYTGYMIGHDRYADGQPLRQYSSGRQDGSGTYILVKA
ncbi:RICIN domain-containing protein [Spirillospora sp. NPDC050679]